MKYSVLVICLLGFALPCWATTFTFDKGADSSNIKTIVASTISGRVYRQPSDNIQNAVVSLFSGSTLIDSKTTGTDGLYSFSGLTTGQTYTISVSKTNDPLQGVNALDLVLVQRHILNITKLTGYKLYSADVNNNRTISTIDLVFISRLLVGLDNSLAAGVWRFTPESYTIPDITTVTNLLPTTFSITTVDGGNVFNILGFKFGDPNFSALTQP